MNEQVIAEVNWWQRNKKKVYIATGVVATGVLVYIGIKNKDAILNIVECGVSALRKEKNKSIPMVIDECSSVLANSEIDKCSEIASTIAPKVINDGIPFSVSSHVRNLGKNRFPSAEKVNLANSLGIVLGTHQTLVDEYMKNVA